LAVLLVSCLYLPAAWSAYKWTDASGRVHYSDTIPPAEIDRSYEKIDKHGMVDKKVEATPDPAQRAEERQRAQRLAEEQAETRRRAVRDQYLIETYQDKSQVEAAYEAKLASIDSSITLANSVVEKLTARRAQLAGNAAANERGGERGGEATQKLEQEIRDIDQQIEHQQKYIEERRAERADMERTAAEDIARFEELHARQLEVERGDTP
jgi:hypothetical protein